MTINDEFFKKTQENLRRIKAQNNQKTMQNYNIDGKTEAQNLSEPQQTQQEDNVIVVDFRSKKSLNTPAAPKKEAPEERMERIRQSIQNINALMKELNERNTK
jgi:hypothetical protein